MPWRTLGIRLGEERVRRQEEPDLWSRFLRSYRRHKVRFVWVKGHADTVENNRCDQLAVAAANDRRTCWKIPGMFPGSGGKPI